MKKFLIGLTAAGIFFSYLIISAAAYAHPYAKSSKSLSEYIDRTAR